MNIKMPENDAMYAHGALTQYAFGANFIYRDHAQELCDVINRLQHLLKSKLIPDAKAFKVAYREGEFVVEPECGWEQQATE